MQQYKKISLDFNTWLHFLWDEFKKISMWKHERCLFHPFLYQYHWRNNENIFWGLLLWPVTQNNSKFTHFSVLVRWMFWEFRHFCFYMFNTRKWEMWSVFSYIILIHYSIKYYSYSKFWICNILSVYILLKYIVKINNLTVLILIIWIPPEQNLLKDIVRIFIKIKYND